MILGQYLNSKSSARTITKKRKQYSPKPLPETRPRRLSASSDSNEDKSLIPIEHESEKKSPKSQYFCKQEQSNLLTSLPIEIRMKIWEYVVILEDFHVVRGQGRLFTILCLGDKMRDRLTPCQHKCWGSSSKPFGWYYGVAPSWSIDTRGCPTLKDVVPLLQTCRLVYSEVVHILYRDTVFRFNHVDTVISFSRTVLSSRLNAIRIVHLAHTVILSMYGEDSKKTVAPYDAKTWEETCRILANMATLRELYIHLGGHRLDSELKDILAPLYQIQQTKTFEVFAGIGRDPAQVYTVGNKPFVFVSKKYEALDEFRDWICC
ncbi:hypothetical protein EYZ11_000377 [Aspergillus tanneri]|nr:hypothetical protein EYZ11_000377 [Aspergillus tanneri]